MNPSFLLDTSCMVAVVCGWHKQHRTAAAEVERRLRRGERLVVSAHALVETYAVLTRLPAPYRLGPSDAWALLEANFVKQRSLVALDSAAYVALLRQLVRHGVAGGRTYDAVIAASARAAQVSTLLTLNRRHFESLLPDVTAVEPLAHEEG